jgi:DNA-directed RNA polymerase subunit omega
MARVTVEDCLEKIDNQYDLVLLAKERTVQLNSGMEMLVEQDNDKNTVVALREIGDGKLDVNELKKSAVARLRKEPDEVEVEDNEIEDENDDFENIYKGQVSKSGAAVLPSKRARKIPEVKVTADDNSSSKDSDETGIKVSDEALELKEEVEEVEEVKE